MDHVPLARPERPRPHLSTLTLLVGRITTIKLTYWAALTVVELALPRILDRPIDERLPFSYGASIALGVLAAAWAAWAARAGDRRLGRLARSIPTIGTAFAAATVVASPASVPLLLVERQRSIEGCAPQATCHLEAIVLWVAVFAIGTVLIPAAFAAGMRAEPTLAP